MPSQNSKPTIGIVMGDPAGIGPEITLKSLARPEVSSWCRPVVIGDHALLVRLAQQLGLALSLAASDHVPTDATSGSVAVLHVPAGQDLAQMGISSQAGGSMALRCLKRAFDLAMKGHLRAIVMAPINKESLAKTGTGYHSEFELFADLAGVEQVGSVVKCGSVFRATVTGHVRFREIADGITESGIVSAATSLQRVIARFGIVEPRLAVAALNPHAGEGGLFGDEEETTIAPAIASLRRDGIDVSGPVPADTVYVRAMRGEFDGVVFLYHDQGNTAMKAAAFGRGVVIYTGIPLVVVSTAHGTAFDIAGKGIADAGNMVEAVQTAVQMVAGLQRRGVNASAANGATES